MIDFDIVLEKVGTFGRYQIVVILGLVYFGIPSGLNAIATVFISYTPDYRCSMYPFDNNTLYPNLTDEMILNMTTPLDEDGDPINACSRYGYNLTECKPNDQSCVNKSEPTIPCDQGYHYDDSLFTETVVTEFDLVCDRRTLDSVASSAYMVGMFLGSFVFGNFADRFGRKLSLIITTTGMLLSMLATSFCHTVELYIVCRVLIAFFALGCNVSIFVYIMEIVGVKWRTFVGIGYQSTFAIGYMLWSGIAYIWRDWHQMQLASFVVSLPFLIIAIIAPESPRWLFTTRRDKKGKRVTKLMARFNKVEIDENFWKEAEKSSEKRETSEKLVTYSTIDLFRHPGLRLVTLKVGFSWAVNSMVYYGISLNAGSLAGDIYVNNALAGVLEIISYIFCALTMDYIGRRLLLTITLTGAGVALIASTIVNEYANGAYSMITLGVVFAFIGKALVSGSFAIIYNFTSELYPTVVRSNGVGFGSMAARIGGILAPFIIGLQDYVSWLPNTIFGAFAVVGGLLSLTFRDTTGHVMMETIEEAELFYAGKSVEKEEESGNSTYLHTYENKIELEGGDKSTQL